MVWVGKDLNGHLFQPPAMGRATSHQTRLLPAPPNLALDTTRDGAPTAPLGNLCQCFTTLAAENFFLTSNLNLPSFSSKPFPLVLIGQMSKLNLKLGRKLLELGGRDLILFPVIPRFVSKLSCRMMHSCPFTLDIHLAPVFAWMPSPEGMQLFGMKFIVICKGLKQNPELLRD